jgi:MFS family permease
MADLTAARNAGTSIPLKSNHDFRLLLRGSSISMLGSRVSAIAYPLLVLAMTGSPIVAGWASFATIAPSIFIYLPAGALVDRWDPRRAMLRSEFGRGTAIAAIVVALALHRLSVAELIGAGAAEQILGIFSALAERRFVRSLVQRGQATSALARSEARTHMVLLLGRPLGGLLFGLGHALPFAADTFSFVASVGVLVRIGKRRKSSRAALVARLHVGSEIRGLVHEISEGLHWLRSNPFADIALWLAAGTTLISQALIMVFIAEAHAGRLSPVTIGLVLAASGAGGALGSATASWLFSHAGYYLLPIQMGVWMTTLGFLAWRGAQSYPDLTIAMAILGFTGALGNIALDTFVIRNAAETILARVMSVDRLASFLALALGPPLGGILFQLCGTRSAIGVLLILTGCLLAGAFLASSHIFPESPFKRATLSSSTIRPLAQPLPGARSLHREAADADLDVPRGQLVSSARDELRLQDELESFPPGDCQDEELFIEPERAADLPIRAIEFLRIVMALLGPAYLIAAQERRDARQQQL